MLSIWRERSGWGLVPSSAKSNKTADRPKLHYFPRGADYTVCGKFYSENMPVGPHSPPGQCHSCLIITTYSKGRL